MSDISLLYSNTSDQTSQERLFKQILLRMDKHNHASQQFLSYCLVINKLTFCHNKLLKPCLHTGKVYEINIF